MPRNPRLKNNQKYCPAVECQRARRRNWKRKQYRENAAWRKKCLQSQKVWRKNRPADQYQKTYRENHADYVLRNRELQRKRNKRRGKEPTTIIVKTHTLLLQPKEDGSYMLSKVTKKMIVNRNALSLQPSRHGSYALLKVKPEMIVNRNALTSAGP